MLREIVQPRNSTGLGTLTSAESVLSQNEQKQSRRKLHKKKCRGEKERLQYSNYSLATFSREFLQFQSREIFTH